MAMRFVTACAVIARLTQLTDAACDATGIEGGMTTCQMKLVEFKVGMTTANGSLCSRYAAYTQCVENLLASCPASKPQILAIMEYVTAQYDSELKHLLMNPYAQADCSSSEPSSENEKQTVSGSNSVSSNQDNSQTCTTAELSTKGSICIQNVNAAAAGGNICSAWQSFECCFLEAFTSCGSDMQSQILTNMSTMKEQYELYDGAFSGLSKCVSVPANHWSLHSYAYALYACRTYSQSGPSPTPAEVETTLMASIQISNPFAFSLDKYVAAVKKATGVSQLPEAMLQAFEIIVKYTLPDATATAAAKAAIAKANGVEESQVEVARSGARRLGAGRRLAMNVDVTITVPDRATAAAVQTSAANTIKLGSQLRGSVSVAKAPVATAKVETKVKSAPSATSQLVSQIESASSDVGGTIKAEVKTAAAQTSTNGASSNFSIVLAPAIILLLAAL